MYDPSPDCETFDVENWEDTWHETLTIAPKAGSVAYVDWWHILVGFAAL